MKLSELVQKYKGNALFVAQKAVEGGRDFLVSFETNEQEAIKAEIMDMEVVSFTASIEARGALPTITVLVKTIVAPPEKEPSTEDNPSEEPTE